MRYCGPLKGFLGKCENMKEIPFKLIKETSTSKIYEYKGIKITIYEKKKRYLINTKDESLAKEIESIIC